MKLASRLAVLAAVAAGAAMSAPLHTETLTFNGYPVSLNDGAVMVGKSSFTGTVTPAFLAWCIVRDEPQVSKGSTFDVNVFRMDDSDLLDLLGVSSQNLAVMAILGSGFNGTNPNDRQRHHGIWEQTNPAFYNLTPAEQALVDAAILAAPSLNMANYFVAMPVAWGTALSVGQPIMWPNPIPGDDTTIPEPGSVVLLLSGLTGGFLMYRRRRVEQ